MDKQLAQLTGKASDAGSGRSRKSSVTRSLPLQDLKELLAGLPDKTANIRNEKLDLANIKTLAGANPHLLKLGGKGAWPTVTLLK